MSRSHAEVRFSADSSWNGRLRKPAYAWIVHHLRVTEPHTGEEPAVSSVSHRGFTHLGLDVAKDSIRVAMLTPRSGSGAGGESLPR